MATSETSCSADHDLSLGDAASLSGMDCDTSEASPYPSMIVPNGKAIQRVVFVICCQRRSMVVGRCDEVS